MCIFGCKQSVVDFCPRNLIVLLENTSIGLDEAVLLDALQKKKPLSAEAIKLLKRDGLVEGRGKNIFISKCSLGDKSRKGTLAGERSWRCWSRIFQIIWKTSKRNIKLKIYWQQCVGTALSFVKIVNGR